MSEPLLAGNEKKYLCQAIDEGEVSSGGRFVHMFEEAFAKWSGNNYAVAVSSGTAALETASWALGDTGIAIPSGTIISCYIAAVRSGCQVYLRDNVPKTYFKKIMRCHLFGKCDDSVGMQMLDDCSQYWKPFQVQDVGCYSLYANKMITSGEGGILVTNRKDVYERAKHYRNLCHTKERFVHDALGNNYRMSNLQAAVALAQLEQIEKFIEIKQKNRDLYLKHLPEGVVPDFKVEIPWMYLVNTPHDAGVMVARMGYEKIEARRFFYPLHKQKCVLERSGYFPVAERLWNHSFYLPSGLNLKEKEIAHVCKKLRRALRIVESEKTI